MWPAPTARTTTSTQPSKITEIMKLNRLTAELGKDCGRKHMRSNAEITDWLSSILYEYDNSINTKHSNPLYLFKQ